MKRRDGPASSDAGRVVWGTGAQEPDSGLLQMRAPFPTVHLSLPLRYFTAVYEKGVLLLRDLMLPEPV